MQLYLLYLQIIPTFVPIKSNPIINKTSTAVCMMFKAGSRYGTATYGLLNLCQLSLGPVSKSIP